IGLLGASAAMPLASACSAKPAKVANFPVQKSDAEWRKLLTPAQYKILRGHGTERPGSSPLNHEKRPGPFLCPPDRHPLFSSATKFDSGTGWPSFWKPLPGAVGSSTDS